MKLFKFIFEPINGWLWSFLCKRNLILFCSSKSPRMPAPIDPGESMGKYLFGKDFEKSYQGITDPELQERLIAAESQYRPRYTALELADIGTMAYGIEEGAPNEERLKLEAELAGLKAGNAVDGGFPSEEEFTENYMKTLKDSRKGMAGFGASLFGPIGASAEYQFRKSEHDRNEALGISNDGRAARTARIAQIETQLAQMPETMKGTPGLFQMLEDQASRAGALQREQLGLQRESDVGALQEFAPQVVDAYRDADPYSTGLAEQQTAMADDLYQRSQGLNPEQQRMADQQALGMAQRQGRVTDQSAVASQVLGRENYLSGLRSQAAGMGQQAFGMNRQLAGDVGMTILGRPSSAIGLGGQMLGQAQQGAAQPMGPQLFDPNVGVNMALQQRGQDVTFAGMQAQADAASSAGTMGAIGSIAGAAIGMCWVAREVYGIENPKWLEFREWMLNDAPSWLRNLYLKYGERTAKFISNKPRVKSIIRKWMNTKIK